MDFEKIKVEWLTDCELVQNQIIWQYLIQVLEDGPKTTREICTSLPGILRAGFVNTALKELEKLRVIDISVKQNVDYYSLNKRMITKFEQIFEDEKYLQCQTIIDQLESKYPRIDIDYDVNKIKNNKALLIKYLEKIIGLESNIYSLTKRYDTLYESRKQHLVANMNEEEEVNAVLAERKIDLKRQIVVRERRIKDVPQMTDYIKLSEPIKPSMPLFDMTKPSEPAYQSPGLFNKKRVLAENEALKAEYENALVHYEKEKNIYEQNLEKYNEDVRLYEVELAHCKEEEKRLNRQAYENKLKAYEQNKEKWESEIECLKEQIAVFDTSYEEEKEQLLNEKISISNTRKIEYEMLYISSLIEKLIEIRNQLWNYGVIYEKYRDHVIIATLCEYLKAGRCDGLEGPNGAYNLYEQESRADIIINKLDTVITSLEEIKKNQYLIYSEIQKVNESLSAIEGQLFVNNLLNTIQISQLNEIAFNTGLTAYNTAVTAYYSQKNAQLAEAMLFTNMLSKM